MRRPPALPWVLVATAALAGCPDGTISTVDGDKDDVTADQDCDDGDPDIYPGAPEVCGNGVDEDCDGADALCPDDLDGDGYAVGDGDCDDGDPAIHPDADEDCTNGLDDDCNGVVTTCLAPELIYLPIAQGDFDSYGVGVFADRIVFGDPGAATGTLVGDGRAALFTWTPGIVDEGDAVALAPGAVGEDGAFGLVVNQLTGHLCVNADYQDGPGAADVGKSWCFSVADVRGAAGTLELAAADFTATSTVVEDYATVDNELDVDGDALAELAIYTADGIRLVDGTGAPWTGEYVAPTAAEHTVPCGSPSYWCGFARAYGPDAIGRSGAGGIADSFDFFHLPLGAAPLTPDATFVVNRAVDDSAVYLPSLDVYAIGSSPTNGVYFVDRDAFVRGQASGPLLSAFGRWVAVMNDQDGHELLLVGAPTADSARGRVYVFDLTAGGLPSSEADALYILEGAEGQFSCGTRARGGIVTDDTGVHTTVALSCPGSGGDAYKLDSRPLPAPLVRAADVYATTPAGHYNLRRWVVDAFTGNPAWAHTLADVEAVRSGSTITGWRLRNVATGSPLHRAGLRTGDIVKKVDDTAVTTPAVVRQLVRSMSSASGATVRFTRAGVARAFTYHVVP